MGKAIKAIGTAIVIGGLIVATGGAAIALGAGATLGGAASLAGATTLSVGGFSMTAGTLLQVGSLVASVGTALTNKKTPSSSGYSTEWMADPDQPIPFAFGRVGAAGLIIHKDEYGGHGAYYSVLSVMSGAGPIKSFGTFKADQKPVTFTGPGGMAKTSEWADYMWRGTRLGTQPDSALLSPTGIDGVLPEWGTAYRTSGKAVYMLTMAQNSKLDKYPDGEPRVLQEVEGLFYWDPRLDSTHPGGFGPCRLDQPSTWVWGENGALFALKWALGLWESPIGKGAPGVGVCVGGYGVSRDGIDIAAFVNAANIADANGWKCAAWPNTKEDKRVVFERLLQSVGAVASRLAGQVSCIPRGAPQPSIMTVTAADTAGPIELDAAMPRLDRINECTYRFWDRNSNWEMAPAATVKVAAYVSEDGGRRARGIDLPYVPAAQQGAQLAMYDIVDSREGISGTIPFKTHMRRIKPGQCFTLDEPGFVLDGQKVKCWGRSIDPMTGVVRIRFKSETDSKHTFALGLTATPPVAPALTPRDPTFVTPPAEGDWTVHPVPPGADGSQVPGFDLSGIVSNTTATSMLIEWAPTADGPWTSAGVWPVTTQVVPLRGLEAGATYYIAITYARGLNQSERRILGPFVANGLVASDLAPGAPTAVLAAKTSEDMAAEILRGALWREYTDGLLYIEGRDVGTVVREAVDEFTSPEGSFAGSMLLLGAKNAAGTGFILNADTVFISAAPGGSAVTSLRSLELTTQGNYQAIQRIDQLVEGFAETSTLLVVNNVVTGIRNTNDGSIGALTFQADVFSFVDPNGGNPKYPIRYGLDGQLVLEDIVIRNANVLGDLVVAGRSIAKSAVSKTAFQITTGTVACPQAATTTVVTVNVNKEEDDSILRILFFGTFKSQDDIRFTGTFLVGNTPYPAGKVNLIMDLANSQGEMPITPFRFLPGLPKGQYSVQFRVLNQEDDAGDLIVQAGAALEVTELKHAAI